MSKDSGVTIKQPMTGKKSLYESGLTLIHPFYGEAKRFKLLYGNWMEYSVEIKDKLNIVVVDDCGTPAMHDLMTSAYVKHCDFNFDIFRITKNLRYNTPGALNLGILASKTEYILIMDSDCTFNPEEMHKIMEIKPEDDWTYRFPRNRITNNAHWKTNDRYLPCTMLFNKDEYLHINGFDEDFTGEYSKGYAFFDNHFDRKLVDRGLHIGIIPWITATEYMDDFVGERISRTKNEEAVNRKLMYDKVNKTVPESKHVLRFPWERTFHHRR